MIMDAHDTYAPDYISKCVERMYEYGVDYVGGIWKILPREDTFTANAIVCAMAHPFGVGNAHYRTRKSHAPIFTDAAAFGCYKREVFEKIGLFDENLARSYDYDFNLRVRKTGRGILLVPDAVIYYYARSTFAGFCKTNFVNGMYVTLPLRIGKRLFSLRHLVPLVFVIGLLGSAALAFLSNIGLLMLAVIGVAYGMASVAASIQAAIGNRNVGYLFFLPLIFAGAHLSYGFGSVWGLFKVAAHGVLGLFNRRKVTESN